MTLTTATAGSILLPDDVDALFVQPALSASIAGQVARTVTTSSHEFRVPRITTDPSAAWVREGEEIPVSDAQVDEVTVVPAKLAGLSVISEELSQDSSPEASAIIGAGLARDAARKLDLAFFGAAPSPAPPGLASLTDVTEVDAGAQWANLDAFSAAIFEAQTRNATIGSWVANPADALALSTVKQSTTSAQALLQPDPTAASRSLVAGLPLLVSTAVPPGTVWGIDPTRALLVVRSDVSIDVDRSAFFTSHRVAIRAVMRVGFGWPDPSALVKITLSGSGA